MRRTIAIVIGMLCVASAALAECPTITATATTSGSTVTYNYRLTNTTSHDIWQFAVFMPSGAADTITSICGQCGTVAGAVLPFSSHRHDNQGWNNQADWSVAKMYVYATVIRREDGECSDLPQRAFASVLLSSWCWLECRQQMPSSIV